jgi:hypothetical protein
MELEDYFVSDEFFDIIYPIFDKLKLNKEQWMSINDVTGYFISIGMSYIIFYSDIDTNISTDKISSFIKKEVNYLLQSNIDIKEYLLGTQKINQQNHVSKILEEELLSQYGQDFDNDKLKKTYVLNAIKSVERTKLHAFNSIYFNSIKENGINPNKLNEYTSKEEMDTINEIFKRHGNNYVFGWKGINSEGTVSYSQTPFQSHHYGLTSPEWFMSFLHCGFGVKASPGFHFNDYDLAKSNIVNYMNEKEFTNEEQEYVISFFDKNWKLYAGKRPILAYVKEDMSDQDALKFYDSYNDFYKGDQEAILDSLLLGRDDLQTDETIDTTNAIYINMPTYLDVVKNIEERKNRNLENQEVGILKSN